MKRFKNILYVLDADNVEQEEIVAKKVETLARVNSAKVCIVNISKESVFSLLGKSFSSHIEKLISMENDYLTQERERIASHQIWADIDTSAELLSGKDFITVIQKVIRNGHDLVIKSRRQSEKSDQFAMRLFRKCPCPVWIINPTQQQNSKKIMGAIDISTDSAEGLQLNKKIIELTNSLALRESGDAYFLHAWQLPHEVMLRSPRFNISIDELVSMKKEILNSRRIAMTSAIEACGISLSEHQLHLIEGETSKVIQDILNDLSIDILVMGTVSRSGLQGLLIGNRAEETLSKVNCTVLAVKPDDFISPVVV